MPTTMTKIKNVDFGYYVPIQFYNRFKEKVPRSITLADALAKVYASAEKHRAKVSDVFSEKKFNTLMSPKEGTRPDQAGSGYRTAIARFGKQSEKNVVRKKMAIMAAQLTVELDDKIPVYKVASALVYLFGEGKITVKFDGE